MSVPNQNSAEGCLSRRIGDSASGSTVPSHGAKIATRTMRISTTAPTIAVGWRRNASLKRRHVGDTDRGATIATVASLISIAHARVEKHIAQIDHQIDQHVR